MLATLPVPVLRPSVSATTASSLDMNPTCAPCLVQQTPSSATRAVKLVTFKLTALRFALVAPTPVAVTIAVVTVTWHATVHRNPGTAALARLRPVAVATSEEDEVEDAVALVLVAASSVTSVEATTIFRVIARLQSASTVASTVIPPRSTMPARASAVENLAISPVIAPLLLTEVRRPRRRMLERKKKYHSSHNISFPQGGERNNTMQLLEVSV